MSTTLGQEYLSMYSLKVEYYPLKPPPNLASLGYLKKYLKCAQKILAPMDFQHKTYGHLKSVTSWPNFGILERMLKILLHRIV